MQKTIWIYSIQLTAGMPAPLSSWEVISHIPARSGPVFMSPMSVGRKSFCRAAWPQRSWQQFPCRLFHQLWYHALLVLQKCEDSTFKMTFVWVKLEMKKISKISEMSSSDPEAAATLSHTELWFYGMGRSYASQALKHIRRHSLLRWSTVSSMLGFFCKEVRWKCLGTKYWFPTSD
jgi:hypothetical protein